jgi:hypothetical protein
LAIVFCYGLNKNAAQAISKRKNANAAAWAIALEEKA